MFSGLLGAGASGGGGAVVCAFCSPAEGTRMPPRLVNHHQRHDDALRTLHEQKRAQQSMRCMLQLEAIIPKAILYFQGAAEQMVLLSLYDRGGEAGIERAARLFATCDVDNDGMLRGAEVLQAARAIRDSALSTEATIPDDVTLEDPVTRIAWERFRELCDDRLHEITLLRKLVPLPLRLAQQTPNVTAIAAGAAVMTQGGETARAVAATEALMEALGSERARVLAATDGQGGLKLLPFMSTFINLIEELRAGQAAVSSVADAHRASAAREAASVEAARRERVRTEAATRAADAERLRRELHSRQGSSQYQDLDELSALLARAASKGTSSSSGASASLPPSENTMGSTKRSSGVAAGAAADGLSSPEQRSGILADRYGRAPRTHGLPRKAREHESQLSKRVRSPRFELAYFERQREVKGVGKTVGLFDMLDMMDKVASGDTLVYGDASQHRAGNG